MWRIYGLCFYGDKTYFVDEAHKTFRQQAIEQLLRDKRIGIYDTATAVYRTAGTAADKDLEVVEATDLNALLESIPLCVAVVTTGEKATGLFCEHFSIRPPKVGHYVEFMFHSRLCGIHVPQSKAPFVPDAQQFTSLSNESGEKGRILPAHVR